MHISEAEAARDFAGLLARVRAGAEVMITSHPSLDILLRAPTTQQRFIEECIALLPECSAATINTDFARDVEEAMLSHRELLDAPAWD